MKGSTNYAGARLRRTALSSAIAAALTGLSAGYVHAQDAAQPPEQLEQITVTGSRIVRQDFTANSPIQTVDQQAFEQTSVIGVETVLNRMPQFVPAVTQFTTGDVQQTATNTVGASTVSLRGLGANRNLVLINGRRGTPIDPTMVVDVNSIPAAAIQRVEIISGGASAVYGADAVGGVVNFILKDNYEGASVDVRFGDTEHGGNQTTTVSGLFGVNSGDDRGNIMLGIERDTRSKQYNWQRDWKVADFANPLTTGGAFAFGSATYFTNEPLSGADPNPKFNSSFTGAGFTTGPVATRTNPIFLPSNWVANPNYNPLAPVSAANPTALTNNPSQAAVNALYPGRNGPVSNSLATTRFRLNRDGTIFSGLADLAANAPGAYRFNGPVYNGNQYCQAAAGFTCAANTARSGDLDGAFQGLPAFVRTPDGRIKENILYNWATSPLERLSGFATGHYDIADNIRMNGEAMVSRTKVESSLGLTAANVNQWGAGVPFGNAIYRGNSNNRFDIPDSLVDVNKNNIADPGIDTTNPLYTLGGKYGVNCDAAPSAAMPWADGKPGCTNSEAWPVGAEMYNLMMTRPDPNQQIWASREPDWLRNALGAGRSATNTTTTVSFTLGLEGDFPSGNHSWDISLTTGRSDNVVNQLGSMRLSSYRELMAFPNFGRNATFDVNPYEFGGFAEGIPTCTSGLPIADNRGVTPDCLDIITPSLKNVREMTQTVLEANLTGTLAEMKNGALQYALGTTYRENSFDYTPDNLSLIGNEIDSIAGLFPNEHSVGEFDVSEIYGELLVPIISDGRTGVEHFSLELGARLSDWSMEQMPNLSTYKALIDWGITPRYRIRGGFNRAFRAPNLGELFLKRTQVFSTAGTRDWCSSGLSAPGTFSATPATPTTPLSAQNIRTRQMCETLMGPSGAAFFYDPSRTQDTVGGVGTPINFGNPNLREEQADTWTLGVAMDVLEDWRLTVDWWKIDIAQMIALESGDVTYQACMDLAFNPSGDLNNPACLRIKRSPATGGAGILERSFTNQGRAAFEGIDFAVNWAHQLDGGGGLNLNASLTKNLHEITQDNPNVAEIDWHDWGPPAGPGAACALQLQCLNYDYRLFTTLGYSRGMWNVSVSHQYWPELKNRACLTNPASVACIWNSLPDYGLMSVSGNIRFSDKYSVNIGIENLADRAPPCNNSNPANTPFATECTHVNDGATYDPLGRTFFVSMRMEF